MIDNKNFPVANEPSEKIQWIDRGWYLALEFELSNSPKFETALELARQNKHFVELVDERGVSLYRTIHFKADFPKFDQLFSIVGLWKSTKMYFKGDAIRKEDFEIWYTCYKTYWGHRKTLGENDFCGTSKLHKFPDFAGCYERNIYLRWRDPLYAHYQLSSRMWYSFGKRQHGVYVVDKPAMAAFLEKTNEEYKACPCYGHAAIERVLHKLPKEINPAIHKDWQFKEDFLKLSASKAYFNYDIAISVIPEICPVNEKAYVKYMERIFRTE